MRNYLLLLMLFPALVFAQKEKLIFAVDLIRHGDRTSVGYMPNSTHRWAEGVGQLTAKGMRQEFELGQKLHKRYMQDEKLLSENYSAETAYFRSTDYDRTLMSAQAFLFGLYPLGKGPNSLPSKFQPLPIHTVPKNQETLLCPSCNSKTNDEYREKYVYTRLDWKNKTKELEPYFKKWSVATGVEVKDLYQLFYLGDLVRIYHEYNIPIPGNLSEEDIQKIIAAEEWVITTLYKPNEVGRAFSKELLTKIDKYFISSAKKSTQLKYVLYSAHDGTILSLFSALKLAQDVKPPYASDVNFALYETSGNQYIVKMTYNDKPVNIPGCTETCTLDKFNELVKRL